MGEGVRKGVYREKNLAAQKIWVEYLSFHGGDFIPLLQTYNTVHIYAPHPPVQKFFKIFYFLKILKKARTNTYISAC